MKSRNQEIKKSRIAIVGTLLAAFLLPPGVGRVASAPGPLPPCVASVTTNATPCTPGSPATPPACIQYPRGDDYKCSGPKTDLFCDDSPYTLWIWGQQGTAVWVQINQYTKIWTCNMNNAQAVLVGPFPCHNSNEFLDSCQP
jgi:hypothetical protein